MCPYMCSYLQIKDKVYDVSGWNEHPGANVIFTMAGEDATDVFAGACAVYNSLQHTQSVFLILLFTTHYNTHSLYNTLQHTQSVFLILLFTTHT